jgi:uncharacterized repeat protein (TIGR01451 family)
MSMLLIPVFAAVVFPPTVTKSFSPPTVGVNQTSTVTITITNPNSSSLTGASMNDSLPPGLVSTGTAATTCGGGSAFASPTLINLAAGTIPANGSCTVTALVFSATPGVYVNSTGNVFSSGPPSLSGGTASITVLTSIPVLSWGALAALALALGALGVAISSSNS